MESAALGRSDPLDPEIERFETFSHGLVRLEPHSIEELRVAVERITSAVSDHLKADGERPLMPGGRRRRLAAKRQRLAAEHERFRTSLAELRLLLAVVEGDDHGGHRQALGQYGRLLTEALRAHRDEERLVERRERERGPPSNHN